MYNVYKRNYVIEARLQGGHGVIYCSARTDRTHIVITVGDHLLETKIGTTHGKEEWSQESVLMLFRMWGGGEGTLMKGGRREKGY
jgi:hypothetical protein